MIVLSHRGYWVEPGEKNKEVAFERSFSMGFGTETDIRDYCGHLVISHDIPNEKSITVERFFQIYKSYHIDLPLALNIKADGLQVLLLDLLKKYAINSYFVFDMAVPDGILYVRHRMNVFTRQSEYEEQPSFYKDAEGIWLDEFHKHWIDSRVLQQHISAGKKVCIVSPDLHGRDYLAEWSEYKDIAAASKGGQIMLCTDYPERARTFFHD